MVALGAIVAAMHHVCTPNGIPIAASHPVLGLCSVDQRGMEQGEEHERSRRRVGKTHAFTAGCGWPPGERVASSASPAASVWAQTAIRRRPILLCRKRNGVGARCALLSPRTKDDEPHEEDKKKRDAQRGLARKRPWPKRWHGQDFQKSDDLCACWLCLIRAGDATRRVEHLRRSGV